MQVKLNEALEREMFLAWLGSVPEDQYAGVAADGCACPVVEYLNAVVGPGHKASWDRVFYPAERGLRSTGMPRWMRNMVGDLDAKFGRGNLVRAGELRRAIAEGEVRT